MFLNHAKKIKIRLYTVSIWFSAILSIIRTIVNIFNLGTVADENRILLDAWKVNNYFRKCQ